MAGYKFRTDCTADEVRRQFEYSPETGALRRIVGRGRGRVMSSAWYGHGKYARVRIGSGIYALHRVIWLHATGAWPEQVIDHINGDPTDNRLANLRSVSPKVNRQNQRRATVKNRTGFLGVHPSSNKFVAQISVQGVIRHLGLFVTPELAHEAYVTAKRAFHEGCTI